MFEWFRKPKVRPISPPSPVESQESLESYVPPLGVIPVVGGSANPSQVSNGYRIAPSTNARWRSDFRISVSTERIGSMVRALAESLLPERCYAILEWAEMLADGIQRDHAYATPFLERDAILAAMDPYLFRLTNDGFVGFGYAWGDPHRFEEIFVSAKKVVQVMTNRTGETETILAQFGMVPFIAPTFITECNTLIGDLFSFAHSFPESHGRYAIDEYRSSVYVPELIGKLGFSERLLQPVGPPE